MDTFPECLQLILAEEGGFSNHRQDPGGLTKYGISQQAYPNVDIANLTIQQASGIYWNPVRGHLLPAGLDLIAPSITFAAEQALRYEFNRNEETFGRGWYRRLFRIYGLALKAYYRSSE